MSSPHTITQFGSPKAPPAGQSHHLPEGYLVGEYEIKGLLADGGMSSVYSAMHPLIMKRAAVKVMNPRFSHDEKAAAQFLLEARAVNQIGHPNIVDVFSLGHLEDGRGYLVMEWLEGETLGQRLWRERIPFIESCEILLQICDALEAAHAQQIVHLDIKPDNVFLMRSRHGGTTVKLLDFGIARLLRRNASEEERAGDAVVGTPHYLSPEQAQASPALDHRSDVYSLGVVAYEMFTGQPPFRSEKVEDLLEQHVHATPPAPDVAWTGCGPALARLVLSLLYKSPARRPTLIELREQLSELRDRAAMPNTQTFAAVKTRPSRTRRWAAWAVTAMAALFAVGWKLERGSRASVSTRSAAPPVFAASPPIVRPSEPPAILAAAPTPVAAPKRKHRRARIAVSATGPTASRSPLGGNDYLIDSAGVHRR